jgi:hypothetical protein
MGAGGRDVEGVFGGAAATDEAGAADWRVAPSGRASPGSAESEPGDDPCPPGVEGARCGGGMGARGEVAAAPATVAGAGEPGAGEPAGLGGEDGEDGEDGGGAVAEVGAAVVADGSGTLLGVVPGRGAADAGTSTAVAGDTPETAPAAV